MRCWFRKRSVALINFLTLQIIQSDDTMKKCHIAVNECDASCQFFFVW